MNRPFYRPPRDKPPKHPVVGLLWLAHLLDRIGDALEVSAVADARTAAASERIADAVERQPAIIKATTLRGRASDIRKGAAFPIGDGNMQVEKLDYKNDTEDALMTLSPDGPTDSPPTWSGMFNTTEADGSVTQTDVGDALEVSGDGKRAILRLPTDVQAFDATIVATAPVDKSDTTEVETISSVFHLAGEHSKATDLGGGASSVAKGAGFP